MSVVKFKQLEYKKKRERVFYKSITGQNVQLCVFRLEKNEKTDHSHEFEQMGYILSGEVEVFIGDNVYLLKTGDAYHIPSNMRHGFSVKTEAPVEYIEIFSPPKPENIY